MYRNTVGTGVALPRPHTKPPFTMGKEADGSVAHHPRAPARQSTRPPTAISDAPADRPGAHRRSALRYSAHPVPPHPLPTGQRPSPPHVTPPPESVRPTPRDGSEPAGPPTLYP
ncbi:hypothetical protein Vlu01_44920 [Micromonospora lutea]|uniref:Uncharacterized protein n=1 Tax=Micromonospora lutea TaxID=419825 RepID=A0ABQ4J1I4_9ACTN|nr:hypothetical protein Vlu01_44920 [Micromonospora lutea]